MADVFISYSRKDIAFARLLHSSLRENEFEPWIDWQDIPPSADWLAEVYEAIEQAETFVFIISETSVVSEICELEIAHASQHNKRLIPIVINDIDPQIVPAQLAALNWIFFREGDEFSKPIQDLVDALQTDQDWVKGHTRYLNRALEWERREHARGSLLRGRDLEEAETWLFQAEEKDPHPTALHSQFVLASRQDVTRRQRTTLGAILAVLSIAIVLGLVAWTQRNAAIRDEHKRATAEVLAVEESHVRATAAIQAVSEAQLRATALSEAETQKLIAEQQRDIALSRQLAAQAMVLLDEIDLSLLLSVQALKIEDSREARSSLLYGLLHRRHLERIYHSELEVALGILAISPDGNLVAAGSEDGKIVLWDWAAREKLGAPLEGHTGEIISLVFSPDSRALVSVDQYGTIVFWLLETRRSLERVLEADASELTILQFNSRGDILASASGSAVQIWNTSTGQALGEPVIMPEGVVASVAFSPDQEIIAVGYRREFEFVVDSRRFFGEEEDPQIPLDAPLGFTVLWDIQTLEMIGEPVIGSEKDGGVTSLAFSSDGAMLAMGSPYGADWDASNPLRGSVRLRDVSTLEKIGYGHLAHYSGVKDLTFSPDGMWLASSDGQSISLQVQREELKFREVDEFPTNPEASSLTFGPDNRTLITGGADGALYLWDLVDRKAVLHQLLEDSRDYSKIAFSPDGSLLVGAGCGESDDDKCIRVHIQAWDMSSLQPLEEPLEHDAYSVTCLVFSPDGTTLATGSYDPLITLSDVRSRDTIAQFDPGHIREVRSLAFSPDGTLLASGGWGSEEAPALVLWDLSGTEPEVHFARYDVENIKALAFSLDGTLLVVGHADLEEPILLFDVSTGDRVGALLHPWIDEALGSFVNGLAFNPDGSLLASAHTDNTVVLWNMSDREILGLPIRGFARDVTQVAFSPDGSMLVTGRDDNTTIKGGYTIQLWDVASRQPVGPALPGNNPNSVRSLAISPDGKYLAARVWEGIELWEFSLESWQEHACRIANRNLTLGEWEELMGDKPYTKTCPDLP
jgi:WD40 repeat protein